MATIPPLPITLRDGERITIVPAGAEHAPGYAALMEQLEREDSFGLVSAPGDKSHQPDAIAERFVKAAASTHSLQLVALNGTGELVGEAMARGDHRPRIAHRADVSINLAAPYRGRGLGGAMMRILVDWAAAHPVLERLSLAVFAVNHPARRLYESLGFVIEGVRKREIRLGPGEYSDDLIMARFVK